MMADPLNHWWLPVLVALGPAVFRLVRGRALARLADDPALAERMLAGRSALSFAFSSALVVLYIVWRTHAVWAIPLEILTFMAAGWPLRRLLFNETWSLGAYLSFYVRLIVAIYGFWILLMTAPWLLNLDGTRLWAAAAGLGVVLLVWDAQYGRLLRALMRTQRVETPELQDRFAAVIAKTRVREPHVEYVDMRGGVFINALALPDTDRPSVLFTGTLLERLDRDEIVAVFAHEVAHLEYFSPAYLRKYCAIGWLLIVSSVAVSPLITTFLPSWGIVATLWPSVILTYMIVRNQHRQKHETDSDLRAVALTGDPEALVRALTKLHALMKMPRRLDPNVEVNASHPSLARRIQAIRNAAGTSAAPLPEPATFASGLKSVTLHADRLVWSEGDVTSFTLPYSTLDELRLDAAANETMRLVLSDREGRKWTLPLAPHDVARAQAALDHVDVGLTAAPARASQWPTIVRLAAMFAMLAAVIASQLAALIVAALAAILPHRPLALAAGLASLVGGFAAMRSGHPASQAAFAIAVGATLLFIAFRDRRDVASRTTWRLVVLIGLLALLCIVPLLVAGRDLLAIHQAARSWFAAVTFGIAFAVAALMRSSVPWRSAAAAAVLVAGAVTVMASTTMLDTWLEDPFLEPTTLTPQNLGAAPSDSFDIEIGYGEILLSPTAASVAAIVENERHEESVHVGQPGRGLKEFAGDQAVFVDDSTVLVAQRGPASTTLRLIDAAAQTLVWEQALDVIGPSLSIDRDTGSWQVLGITVTNHPVRITGTRAGVITGRREWSAPVLDEESTDFVLWSDGARLLVNSRQYVKVGLAPQQLGQFAMWLMNPWRSESRLVLFDGGAARDLLHSVLDVNCHAGTFADEWPICEAYDGSRTHVSIVNPGTGSITPLTSFHSRLSLDFARGWATGYAEGRPFAINASARELVVADWRRDDHGNGPGYFVNGDSVLGLVRSSDDSSRVNLYRGFDSGRVAMR